MIVLVANQSMVNRVYPTLMKHYPDINMTQSITRKELVSVVVVLSVVDAVAP